MNEAAVVVGVRRLGQRHRLLRRIGYEDLLSGRANTLPPMMHIDFLRVVLEPGRVTIETLAPHSRLGIVVGVSDLLYHDRRHDLIVHALPPGSKPAMQRPARPSGRCT